MSERWTTTETQNGKKVHHIFASQQESFSKLDEFPHNAITQSMSLLGSYPEDSRPGFHFLDIVLAELPVGARECAMILIALAYLAGVTDGKQFQELPYGRE